MTANNIPNFQPQIKQELFDEIPSTSAPDSPLPEPGTLAWKNHHERFFSQVQKLWDSQILTDFTLICGEKAITVHKLILAAHSELFESEFTQNPDSRELDISFIGPMHFEQLVNYIYTGEVVLLKDELEHFKMAASLLRLQGFEDPAGENVKGGKRSKKPLKRKPEEEIHVFTDAKKPKVEKLEVEYVPVKSGGFACNYCCKKFSTKNNVCLLYTSPSPRD